MPVPNLTLSGGNFEDFEGHPLNLGYLIMELNHDESYSAGPYQVVAGLKQKIQLDALGNINPTVQIWSNDVLTPANSFYTIIAYKADGTQASREQIWILASSPNPINVGNVVPLNPPGVTPILSGGSSILLQTNSTTNNIQNILNLIGGSGGVTIVSNSFGGTTISVSRIGAIQYTIDGGGSVISTGVKGQLSVPACTITGWVLTADQSGSAVIDVLSSTYTGFPVTSSIASTDKPTLSGVQKNQNLAVSVWTSIMAAGSEIQFNVNSASTVTRLNLTIYVTIP